MTDRAADDPWAPLAKRFVDDHYGSLSGRVRTHVIHEHLRNHLAPERQRVVDVGGGAGNQSVPLARAGHDVTIVDPSAAMLERADARLANEADEVAARVRLVQARGEAAPTALDAETFDVVLCHGVLMYLDDPEPLVDALCKLTRPSGLVSIVAKNVAVMALRHAHEGDWTAAIAAFDSERTRRRHPRRPHRPPVSADRSARRRTRRVVWRASLHGRLDPRRAATDPEDLVLQAELMASQRDPYRQLSRLFQLVGRRPA